MHARLDVVGTAAEMRILGGSEDILFSSRGHTLGSTAIEAVMNLDTPASEWVPFCQQLADTWLSPVGH